MATRDVNLIIDTKSGKAQKSFTDRTPTTLAEILGGSLVKDDRINLNIHVGAWSGGAFVTQDISGDTFNVVFRRPGKGPIAGSMNWSCGASTQTGTEFPLSADTFEQELNAMSVVQADVTSVKVWKEGTSYIVQGADDANLTAISIDEINAIPVCSATVTTVTAGSASNKEVQAVDIAEAALVSATSFSDIATPSASVTTNQAGSASVREIQTVSISGNPDSGNITITGPTTSAVVWDIDASPSEVKNAINTDTSGLVASVEKVGQFDWRITFEAFADATVISATYSGTEYHGINGQVVFNTVNAASVFAATGEQVLEGELQFRVTGTDTDTLYRESLKLDKSVIDASTASALDAASSLTWLNLSDTDPTSYSGQAGKVVKVNSGEDGLEFGTDAGGLGNVVEDTTPQLGGQLDVNGQSIGDGTAELLKFSETGSAVNEVTVTNAATGNGPSLSATGDDANIDLNLAAKGTGGINLGGAFVTDSVDDPNTTGFLNIGTDYSSSTSTDFTGSDIDVVLDIRKHYDNANTSTYQIRHLANDFAGQTKVDEVLQIGYNINFDNTSDNGSFWMQFESDFDVDAKRTMEWILEYKDASGSIRPVTLSIDKLDPDGTMSWLWKGSAWDVYDSDSSADNTTPFFSAQTAGLISVAATDGVTDGSAPKLRFWLDTSPSPDIWTMDTQNSAAYWFKIVAPTRMQLALTAGVFFSAYSSACYFDYDLYTGSEKDFILRSNDGLGQSIYWDCSDREWNMGQDVKMSWRASGGHPSLGDVVLQRSASAQLRLTDTLLVDTAVIVGTADTSGVRLDLDNGHLAIREGDDSADTRLSNHHMACELYVSTSGASANITVVDTYVNLFTNATLSDGGQSTSEFTWDNTNKQIDYSGPSGRDVMVMATVSMTSTQGNAVASFRFAQNGTAYGSTEVQRKIGSGTDVGNCCMNAMLTLTNGDTIEVHCALDTVTGTETITAEVANISIISI